MSLDTVVDDIIDGARERADEIETEAEAEADAIVAEAEREAEEIIEAAEREVERTIEQEREQARSSANLEAKQRRLEARRDVLAEVRDAVEERIAGLSGDRREELTRTLLADAAEEYDTGPVRVYGRAEDADLIAEILTDYDDYEYAGEVDCLGGVVLESDTSRIRVNNTFDSRLENVWEDNLREISDRLFEE